MMMGVKRESIPATKTKQIKKKRGGWRKKKKIKSITKKAFSKYTRS